MFRFLLAARPGNGHILNVFETILATVWMTGLTLLYLVLWLLPLALLLAAPAALALLIDAIVAPRARLTQACAGLDGGDLPRASVGPGRREGRLVARFVVVPIALLTSLMLLAYAHPAVSIVPSAALLLLARAAYRPEIGAFAAAALAVRLVGILLLVVTALFALVAGPFALFPLLVAGGVYAGGRARDEGEIACATVLLGMVIAPVVLGYAEGGAWLAPLGGDEMALVTPLALVVGGIAWRVEVALGALPRLTARTLDR